MNDPLLCHIDLVYWIGLDKITLFAWESQTQSQMSFVALWQRAGLKTTEQATLLRALEYSFKESLSLTKFPVASTSVTGESQYL